MACRFGRFHVPLKFYLFRATALLFLALIISPQSAFAQAVYGSVAGTVNDPSGATLPGVTVTITSVERKTVDTVITNEAGQYVKDRLLPGKYEVAVELTGFKRAVYPDIQVNVDTQTRLDVQLQVGAVTEAVTVEGFSPLLKTDRADVATSFDERQITELPLLDRNFTKLILLTPGTQQLQWNHAASENPQGSTQTMVNGQHFSGTTYQLDGTENRDPILGIIVINPTLESIGETKITSQNYDAEFGQATAGVVSVQTKSGTNQFRGSAFEFHQSDWLQARNPYTQALPNPLTGRLVPETTKDQFGGSLGGPIAANTSFFFGDYQGIRSSVGGSNLMTVPTEAARRGDLSEYGVPIFDPRGGAPANRQQFANGQIPQELLSPQALAILELIPLPNRPGVRDNFVVSGAENFDADQFTTRIDQRVNERMNVFGRYSWADFKRNGPTAFGEGGGRDFGTLGGVSQVNNQSLAVGLDRTFSASSFLDVRFGFFRYKVDVLPVDFGTTPATDLGIPGLNFDDFSSGLFSGEVDNGGDYPGPGGPGNFRFGSGLGVNRCNCPLAQNEKQWQIVSNYTRLEGNHTMKFGVDIRRAYNLRVPSDQHRSGALRFNGDRTRGPEGGGLPLATFLLGDVTSFARFVSTNTDARERQWRQFYYAQDTWRPHQNLTLNYGLRLDIISPQTVNEPGNGGWLNLDTGEIQVGGIGDIDLAGNVENSFNWAPRVGVTYQLNEKTVLRAGYGRSYDLGVFGSTFGHSVTQNLPVLSIQNLNAAENFERVFTLATGPPPPEFVEVPPSGRLQLPNGISARALRDKQTLPTLDAWNVTAQRELSAAISLEVAYVANRGKNVFTGNGPAINANEPTLEGFPDVPQNLRRPFFAGPINGFGGAFGWTQGIDYFCNCATNSYHSMQTKLTKRFSGGNSLLAQYTLQRARNHDTAQFFFNPDLQYGPPANFDRVHNFTAAAVAELPFGRGRAFASDVSPLVNAFIGGWQLNTNVTIQSGMALDVTYRGAGADRDVGPNRPNVIGDITEGGGDRNHWFNTTPIGSPGSAFERPAVGTFGNMERGGLRGPGYWRVDASLFKRLPVMQERELELRVEVVNVFNHVNLGDPDTEIGVPGNDNPNAGKITSTAFFNADPQRTWQFGLRFKF
jgi:outer membrane receptor protein involved in Fe transport